MEKSDAPLPAALMMPWLADNETFQRELQARGYRELCHACWYVGYFLGIARPGWKPTETAMAGRHLTKYVEPVQPGFVAAIRAIFNAYEDHPDGEKQFPPIPVNFGN